MSFAAYELSNEQGQPIKLYDFCLVNSLNLSTPQSSDLHWYYTNADEDITIGNITYLAIPISDQGVSQSGDAQQDNFTINISARAGFAYLYQGTPPINQMRITVSRYQAPDAAADNIASVSFTGAIIFYIGALASISRKDQSNYEITAQQLSNSFQRGGLRLTYIKTCPFLLYDYNCTVNPENFAVDSTIVAMTGNSISCADVTRYAADYFDGGYFKWPISGQSMEYRGLLGRSGNTLTDEIGSGQIQPIPRLVIPQGQFDAGDDDGPDYQTLVDDLYSGEVRPFADDYDSGDVIYYFLRKDYDLGSSYPQTVDTNFQKLYAYSNGTSEVVLYRWNNAAGAYTGDQEGGFAGSTENTLVGAVTPELLVMGSTDGLKVGMRVKLYPGCDRTSGANGCQKFQNNANFGGFEQLSGRSPFDGNPVW